MCEETLEIFILEGTQVGLPEVLFNLLSMSHRVTTIGCAHCLDPSGDCQPLLQSGLVTQSQCTATRVLARCSPQLSVLLRKAGSQQACDCNHTYRDLLFTHLCSDPTLMHCNTGLGKVHASAASVALQSRLTAGLSHSNYTYGDLLFIQMCIDPMIP